MAMPKGWDSKKPDSSDPPIGKESNSKTRNYMIIGAGVAGGVIAAVIIIGIVMKTQESLDNFSNPQPNMDRASISHSIISGDYDTFLRQKCIEKLKSYGLDPIPEGSINLCVDTAKAIAYNELNK